MKKIISVLLALCLCCGGLSFALAAAPDAFTILNPYEGVDWQSVRQYKTALHTHTNASDGGFTLPQSIGRHIETGFDIVAVTDHGTIDRSWISGSGTSVIKTGLDLLGRSEGDITYLGASGTFENGVNYTCRALANTDEFVTTDTGRTVLKIPYGIENNAISANAHVNSWFAPYVDNSLTTYEDAVKGVAKAGGVCVINHPGEYTKARYEIRTENAYDENNYAYAYYINKFAGLIDEYDALIGIDINSKGDNRTRFDRKLWDILLTRFAANGKNVFAICSSDAHQLDKIDTGFSVLLMPAYTSAAARAALQAGHFFGASHCLGNYDELVSIADALREICGEGNGTYLRVRQAADAMKEKIEGIESGVYAADEDIGLTYSVLDENGYTTVSTFPKVTGISVDEAANTVSLETENALLVRFISNGSVVAVKPANDAVIDLDDCAALLGDYVRAEVFGDGGMLYTQAFLLNAEEKAGDAPIVKGVYFNLGFIDCLLAIFHNWYEIIVRWAGNLR